MQVKVYNLQGKSTTGITLPKAVFGEEENLQLLAQATRVYLSNQRQAGAKAKRRGEIERTKAKWFRQKGTGRARHGARSASIFVGGGKAHGPTGSANYQKKLSKKMMVKALTVALSVKANEKKMRVITSLEKIEGKTKEIAQVLKKVSAQEKLEKTKPQFLLVLPEKKENIFRAGRNLANLRIDLAKNLNPYQVLQADFILFSKEAVKKLEERLKKPSFVKTTEGK